MKCPNCSSETYKTTSISSKSSGKTFVFCPYCPKSVPRETNFPMIVTAKPSPELERYALSAEEIARTQAMKPSVRMYDTPKKRYLADVDSIKRGDRAVVYIGGTHPDRERIAQKKISKQLRTDDYKIIADDGTKVIAERAHA